MEPNPDKDTKIIREGRSNLEICPNCLEPNPQDLAVCSYCGRPLHPVDEDSDEVMTEDEQTLAAARAEAVPAEKKPDRKKQQNGFRRIMPWLGLYLIYNAIISCIEIGQQRKLPTEEQPNFGLAYLSAAIWFAAGLLMAWPLVKKGWRKLRHLPEEEEEEQPETPQQDSPDEEAAEEETVSEVLSKEDNAELSDDKAGAEEAFEKDEDPVMTDKAADEAEAEEEDGEPSE